MLSESREEKIGRIFSNVIEITPSEFIFSIIPHLSILNFSRSNILKQDDLFTKSLEKAKESFDKKYRSITNPDLYSLEAILKRGIFDIANGREPSI